MNYLVLVFCFVMGSANAATIDCYSGANNIYHGEPKKVLVNANFILATYDGYNEVIFTKDCIVKEVA